MGSEEFIWVNRWDEFQTFQKKRGKPWAPPWVKLYTRILDEPSYLDLTPETRSLLVGLWALFGRSHGTVTKDTRRLSQQLHQRVTKGQLDSLNHAGWISFCSGTDLERRRSAFWNSSGLEESRGEEIREEPIENVVVIGPVETVGNVDNALRQLLDQRLEDIPL